MISAQTSMLSIRVSNVEKEKFKLLSAIENKTVSQLVKELVNKQLASKKLNAVDIRKLPKESRKLLLNQMTKEAMPVYNKYKDELIVDEIGDGIE